MSNPLNYTQCGECCYSVPCGISQPGYGCYGGSKNGPEVPELVFLYFFTPDDVYRPFTEGSAERILKLQSQLPRLFGNETKVMPIREVFFS